MKCLKKTPIRSMLMMLPLAICSLPGIAQDSSPAATQPAAPSDDASEGPTDADVKSFFREVTCGPAFRVSLALREQPSLVNAKGKKPLCETPIHAAARAGLPGVVKVLLDNGAEISARDSRGKTPLHIAASQCWSKTVELLISAASGPKDDQRNQNAMNKKAAVNACCNKGWTPLHQAALFRDSAAAMVFRLAGVEYDQCDPTYVAKLLLSNGADVNARIPKGKLKGLTPFGLAQLDLPGEESEGLVDVLRASRRQNGGHAVGRLPDESVESDDERK